MNSDHSLHKYDPYQFKHEIEIEEAAAQDPGISNSFLKPELSVILQQPRTAFHVCLRSFLNLIGFRSLFLKKISMPESMGPEKLCPGSDSKNPICRHY